MVSIKKILKNTRTKFRTTGFMFAGNRKQTLRSDQVALLSSLTKNQKFIADFPELLTCNEGYESVADKIDVSKEVEKYVNASKVYLNYPGSLIGLEAWVDSKGHQWPNLHPAHKQVVDVVREYKPKSVLDIGAGAGVVSKYVYAADPSVKITCVEGSQSHIDAMRVNFSKESKAILPQLQVKAEIVKAIAQNLPFKDNSFELVFMCTVMMHNPFIAGVLAACEAARVSSKYILHVEGNHTDGVVQGFRTPHNLHMMDYERLYQKLGFKKVKKFFYRDPYMPGYDYIVFLAEK